MVSALDHALHVTTAAGSAGTTCCTDWCTLAVHVMVAQCVEVVHDLRHPTAGDGLKVTLDVERKASQKIIAELKSVAAKLEWVHMHTHTHFSSLFHL